MLTLFITLAFIAMVVTTVINDMQARRLRRLKRELRACVGEALVMYGMLDPKSIRPHMFEVVGEHFVKGEYDYPEWFKEESER